MKRLHPHQGGFERSKVALYKVVKSPTKGFKPDVHRLAFLS